jgi:hypothetical protein
VESYIAQGLKLLNIPNNSSEHAFRHHYLPLLENQRLSHRLPLSPPKVGPDAVGCDVMQRVKVDLASGSQATGCPCSFSRLFLFAARWNQTMVCECLSDPQTLMNC